MAGGETGIGSPELSKIFPSKGVEAPMPLSLMVRTVTSPNITLLSARTRPPVDADDSAADLAVFSRTTVMPLGSLPHFCRARTTLPKMRWELSFVQASFSAHQENQVLRPVIELSSTIYATCFTVAHVKHLLWLFIVKPICLYWLGTRFCCFLQGGRVSLRSEISAYTKCTTPLHLCKISAFQS